MGLKQIFKITLLVAMIQTSALAGITLSPIFDIGLESNDNLELASSNAKATTARKLELGINLSGYLHPDFAWSTGYSWSSDVYFDSDLGQYDRHNTEAEIAYMLTPQLTLSTLGEYESYIETDTDYSQYQKTTITPKFSYYFTPNFGVEGFASQINYDYIDTSAESTETQYGGTAYIPINYWADLGLGYTSFNNEANSEEDNYDGKILKAEIIGTITSRQLITLQYTNTKTNYPNSTIEREDTDSAFAIQFLQFLKNDLYISAGYSYTERSSSDESENFNNGIAFLGLRWNPEIGNKYDFDARSYRQYLYEYAENALNNGNLGGAEKQFQKLIFFDAKNAKAFAELGYIYTKLNHRDAAITHLETAIFLDETQLESYYLLAFNYIKINDKKMARMVLEALSEKTDDKKVTKILETL